MTYVFDACALLAFARREAGRELVRQVLFDNEYTFVHALNLCEVFYDLHRTEGATAAEEFIAGLESMGVVIREDMDQALWQRAGVLKSQIKRLSLADTIALSFAVRMDATLLTSDHKEFDPLVDKGICSIEFIR